MNYELTTLLVIGGGYLVLLFAVAYFTDKGWVPSKLVNHPIVYVLSPGVFASIWAYYTSMAMHCEKATVISRNL